MKRSGFQNKFSDGFHENGWLKTPDFKEDILVYLHFQMVHYPAMHSYAIE